MALRLRLASEDDVPLLARMNRRLIEDEGSRNPMSVAELERRMREWIAGEWSVEVFEEGETPVGYAVYQRRTDEYDTDRAVVYLRQFFVERAERGRGIGRRAFDLLAQSRFPAGATVVIDVLAANPGGAAFWARLGFAPYCATMHWKSGGAGRDVI